MNPRNQSLDILRCFAILLVLTRHIMHPHPGHNQALTTILNTLIRGGWSGVDLFFVLSGFLISGLLFKEHLRTGRINFKNFFVRRGLKIYPSFYLMLLCSGLFPFFDQHLLPTEIFFMQDYFLGLWNHTWSLGVEEKFYLLLPIVLMVVLNINRAKAGPFHLIPAIAIGIALSCLILRTLNVYVNPPTSLITHAFPFHLRLDSLMAGVMVSYYYHYHAPAFKDFASRYRYVLLVLGVFLFIPAFIVELNSPFILSLGFTLLYIGSGLILIAFIDDASVPTRLSRSLAFIGAHSYSIYLWHMPLSSVLDVWRHHSPGPINWYIYLVLYLGGSIIFGILMSKTVEYPVLKIRDRLFPRHD